MLSVVYYFLYHIARVVTLGIQHKLFGDIEATAREAPELGVCDWERGDVWGRDRLDVVHRRVVYVRHDRRAFPFVISICVCVFLVFGI